jgi:hypothetical protein
MLSCSAITVVVGLSLALYLYWDTEIAGRES